MLYDFFYLFYDALELCLKIHPIPENELYRMELLDIVYEK